MRPLLWVGIFIAFIVSTDALARPRDEQEVLTRVRRLVEEVRAASFPELQDAEIQLKLFDSRSDYFQTRFTFTSFLFQPKLRYLLKVNRRLFDQPTTEDALRAILAHELGHIVYYQSKRRLQLLSLVRLASQNFTAGFERGTDLLAITHGYGIGLKAYREWLYQHIPAQKLAAKKRNYFSPEEIEVLLRRLQQHPEQLQDWVKQPPRSRQQIEQNAKSPPDSAGSWYF